MGELIVFPEHHESFSDKAERIRWEAVCRVTNRYGDGYDDTDLLPEVRPLAYHNMQHTVRVIDTTRVLARSMRLNSNDADLAMLAAAAHDVCQEGGRGEMEARSATWLADTMRAQGFADSYITTASLAIVGTEPIVDADGVMTGQHVSHMEFPDRRSVTIALVVASADMGDLFAPYGPLLSRALYQEDSHFHESDMIPINEFLLSQKRQLQLLSHYHYPITAAEELFGKNRQRIIDYQECVTGMVQAGQIVTWQQLLDADSAFSQLFDVHE